MTYEIAIASMIAALADSNRRALLERLRGGPLPVGALAEDLPISRPAVSQHLKVLSNAGLLMVEAKGSRRLYRLAPCGLDDMRAWLDGLRDDALAGFAARPREIATESPEK